MTNEQADLLLWWAESINANLKAIAEIWNQKNVDSPKPANYDQPSDEKCDDCLKTLVDCECMTTGRCYFCHRTNCICTKHSEGADR